MDTVIIDVRTAKEFLEYSYPGAINIPSGNFDISHFDSFRDKHISLVCFSGNRANRVRTQLENAGFSNVSIMQNQMVHLIEGKRSERTGWTIDRQFRLALGLLIGLFLLGNYILNSPFSIALLIIVFSGLLYSALSDNCYLKELISILPWNKGGLKT